MRAPVPMKNLYTHLKAQENTWKDSRQSWRKQPEQLELFRVNVVDEYLEQQNIPSKMQKNNLLHRMSLTIIIVTMIKQHEEQLQQIHNLTEQKALTETILLEIEEKLEQEQEKLQQDNMNEALEEPEEKKDGKEFTDQNPAATSTPKEKPKPETIPSLKEFMATGNREQPKAEAQEQTKSNSAPPRPSPKPERDLYKDLGISRDASERDVKKAYRKMALKHHPDKNPDDKEGATERFKVIGNAYETLGDKDQRATYDNANPSAGLSDNASQQASSSVQMGAGAAAA